MSSETHPTIRVAVVLERIAAPNAWEDWKFLVAEVVPDEGAFGPEPRCLRDDGKVSRWLHPGFEVGLFPDECKGYFLNLTSGQPSWFVSWIVDEADRSMARVTAVSLSYIEADRRMTADEQVDNLPLAPELCEWLQDYTNRHFVPDDTRKVRAVSFLGHAERERHARQMAQQVQADAQESRPEAAPAPAPGAAPAADDPAARNAALRAMFHSDPHFAQSDGLDVALDEVIEVQSSPLGRQRKILKARALGLLDDELLDQDPPPSGGPD